MARPTMSGILYQQNKQVLSWGYMLMAFLLFIVADIIWSLFTDEFNNLIWPMRSVMDTLWIIEHICFMQSFLKNNSTDSKTVTINNTP